MAWSDAARAAAAEARKRKNARLTHESLISSVKKNEVVIGYGSKARKVLRTDLANAMRGVRRTPSLSKHTLGGSRRLAVTMLATKRLLSRK